jgi:hypothetical protein
MSTPGRNRAHEQARGGGGQNEPLIQQRRRASAITLFAAFAAIVSAVRAAASPLWRRGRHDAGGSTEKWTARGGRRGAARGSAARGRGISIAERAARNAPVRTLGTTTMRGVHGGCAPPRGEQGRPSRGEGQRHERAATPATRGRGHIHIGDAAAVRRSSF